MPRDLTIVGNPHNILENSQEWAQFEFSQGRGDMVSLMDMTRRCKLWVEIVNDSSCSMAIRSVIRYLLEVDKIYAHLQKVS